jgi:hypothetical protein
MPVPERTTKTIELQIAELVTQKALHRGNSPTDKAKRLKLDLLIGELRDLGKKTVITAAASINKLSVDLIN